MIRKEKSMRRISRIVITATFVAVLPVLAGCSSFDPDSLDVFGLTEKKKLPGERKAVFPDGVPGVTPGVPQQYLRGNQPTADAAMAAPVQGAPVAAVTSAPADETPPAAAAAPAERPKVAPRRKVVAAKPAAKPRPAAAAPVQPVSQDAAPQQQAQPAPEPWPAPAQAPAQSSGTAAWPAPPPSGTFSR